MVAAHSQVASAGELSVALRCDGIVDDVRRALWEEHSLIRTYGPRGTVHLLSVADMRMWIGVLGEMPPTPGPFPPDVRLTDSQTEEVLAAIGGALAKSELTLDELSEAVVNASGPWAGDLVMPAFQEMWPRWRQAIALAAARGLLCFGPNRGRKVTYTSPRRYVPDLDRVNRSEASAQLIRAYLHAYGPATPDAFARWLGAPRPWVKYLFADLGERIETVGFEGGTAFVNAGDTAWPSPPPAGIRLLPYFDTYVVACQPRQRLFPRAAAERALSPSGQAGNYPVLMVDDVVAGVWHLRRSGRRGVLTVEPLQPLPAARGGELEDEVDRIGTALGIDAELSVGPVTVGPHA